MSKYTDLVALGAQIKNWQSDMFVRANQKVDEYIKQFPAGEVGHYTTGDENTWHIFYDSYDPWYAQVKEIAESGKNPILEMHARFRDDAFRDGSFYKPMEDGDYTILYGVEQTGRVQTVMSIHDSQIMVDLVNLDEGINGDYNEADPDDQNLLRFDAFYADPDFDPQNVIDGVDADGWLEIPDASFCTMIPATSSREELEACIRTIHTEYRNRYEEILAGESVENVGEALSYISPDNLEVEIF